jgi:hypothetical protein
MYAKRRQIRAGVANHPFVAHLRRQPGFRHLSRSTAAHGTFRSILAEPRNGGCQANIGHGAQFVSAWR